VITEHANRPARYVVLYGIDRPGGIGAVADEIAEKRIPIGCRASSMREAGGKGFAIRMDVRQQSNAH
jgi:hypothetical protein